MRSPLPLVRPRRRLLITSSSHQNHVVTSSIGFQPEKPDPEQYLRKDSRKCRDRVLLPSVEHHNRNKDVIKPPVPSRDEKPVQGLTTSKDFVNCNAVEIINSSPKRMDAEVPYNKREDYGKVPAYLETVKEEIEKEKAIVETYVVDSYGSLQGAYQKREVMDEQERWDLINKLKQRWGDVNSEYQKYCHKVILDTPGEIKRKASQEAELKQLEEDIEKLSCPGPLVVV